MRLLHLVHSINPDRGGPSEAVRMFVEAHRQAGNEVEIATLDAPNPALQASVNCPVHTLGPGILPYGYSPRMKHWLQENYERFDGAIVHGIWQYHLLAARQVLSGRRPYLVFSHGMLDPYFKHRYPFKHLKKWIYWVLTEHKNLHQATTICFTSEEEKRSAGIGFPRVRLHGTVIPYGTAGPTGDPEHLRKAFYQAVPGVQAHPYFLFLSRLHEKKGCDLLIRAFAEAADPNYHLVMAGPDITNIRPELQNMARRLGVADRIHWPGMLRGDAKWGAFYAAEAFALPSHQENFGIAVADALSCALIPLVSDKVNIAPEVAAADAAFMEPDTIPGTISLIKRFHALSADEKAEMAQRGLRYYKEHFSPRNSSQLLCRALGLLDLKPVSRSEPLPRGHRLASPSHI